MYDNICCLLVRTVICDWKWLTVILNMALFNQHYDAIWSDFVTYNVQSCILCMNLNTRRTKSGIIWAKYKTILICSVLLVILRNLNSRSKTRVLGWHPECVRLPYSEHVSVATSHGTIHHTEMRSVISHPNSQIIICHPTPQLTDQHLSSYTGLTDHPSYSTHSCPHWIFFTVSISYNKITKYHQTNTNPYLINFQV